MSTCHTLARIRRWYSRGPDLDPLSPILDIRDVLFRQPRQRVSQLMSLLTRPAQIQQPISSSLSRCLAALVLRVALLRDLIDRYHTGHGRGHLSQFILAQTVGHGIEGGVESPRAFFGCHASD